MLIIGCDYHPSFQQIAFLDNETGEVGERRLVHREEAEQFYSGLKEQNLKLRVGMEASGHARWFERWLQELRLELWIGDAAQIRTKRVRKQKTDRQDAQLLLQLMLEERFPRIWVPDAANRDLRQLLWHRHRLVQMRTRGERTTEVCDLPHSRLHHARNHICKPVGWSQVVRVRRQIHARKIRCPDLENIGLSCA